MGVEYGHFLIPRPNDFFPTTGQLLELLKGLRDNRWICQPTSESFGKTTFGVLVQYEYARETGAFARTPSGYHTFPYPDDENWLARHLSDDLLLCWPVERLGDAGLEYPFIERPADLSEAYYKLQLRIAPNYVYYCSELIDPFPSPLQCRNCGEELEFWQQQDIFYAARIHHRCPQCQTKADVSHLEATVRDGWNKKERLVAGGATYRFALVVDCGKFFPSRSGESHLQPKLIDLFNDIYHCSFHEISDLL